jgi:hypothetical protein
LWRKKENSTFSKNSYHAGRVFEFCKIEVMTFRASMYDVSTLYVIRETFHFAVVLNKFNQTRSRSLLWPSFCRLDGHREANKITKQHVNQRNTFRILKSILSIVRRKYGIPYFPRIHTMLAGFCGPAKSRYVLANHRCTMYLRFTFTVKKYKGGLVIVKESGAYRFEL